MKRAKNAIHVDLVSWFKIVAYSILIIAAGWGIMIFFVYLGLSLPEMKNEHFFQLGFFAVSTFGLITFLSLPPLQTAASSLSPLFLARMYDDIKTHLALYILLISSLLSFFIVPLSNYSVIRQTHNELFYSMAVVCTFAIIAHRFWMIRLLHQPSVVYQRVKELNWGVSGQRLWNELFECAYKAIKQGRVSDACYFLEVMSSFYNEFKEGDFIPFLRADIQKLKEAAQELTPCLRVIDHRFTDL